MGVVIANGLVLSDSLSGGGIVTADNPIVGYQTLVTAGNLSTTTEDPAHPADNMANPATHLRWKGLSSVADEIITIAADTAELVDYIGIARHNFFSAQIAVSIEVLDAGWTEIVADFIPPSDGPLVIRFAPRAVTSIRIRLQPGVAAPTAAVVFLGKLLVLQRRIYVGHVPMPMGVEARVTNARSESGNFLGRIVLNETTRTQVEMQNLTPDWVRQHLNPFLRHARENPFFFAWRPGSYPGEAGFGWMTNNPMPSNQLGNGMMKVQLQIGGIV